METTQIYSLLSLIQNQSLSNPIDEHLFQFMSIILYFLNQKTLNSSEDFYIRQNVLNILKNIATKTSNINTLNEIFSFEVNK